MDGSAETVLVVGATSDIGRAIARKLAGGGCALQLAARNPARLERVVYPDHRKQYGFDNLDFNFDQYGTTLHGICLAAVPLPEYGIAKIRTGNMYGWKVVSMTSGRGKSALANSWPGVDRAEIGAGRRPIADG